MVITYTWERLRETISLLHELVSCPTDSGSRNVISNVQQPQSNLLLLWYPPPLTLSQYYSIISAILSSSLFLTLHCKFMAPQWVQTFYFWLRKTAIFCQEHPPPPPSRHLLNNQLHTPGEKRKFQRPRSPGNLGSTQKTAVRRHSGASGSSGPHNNYYWRGGFTAATVVKWR